ncbi:hypothetical protein C8Q72DRAFT_840812, partial [Fomitopsis betulina]
MDVTRFAASTASVLYGDNPPYLGAQIAPILAPRGEASGQVEREFLAELTQRAAAAALSLACGSILAGRTSESDEYGDVALWLGKGDFGLGREREILDALALRSRLTPRPKVWHVDLSPSTCLPVSLPTAPDGAVADLTDTLSRLDSLHCFRVQGVAGDDSVVLYVLLGQLTTPDGSSPWVGLMGLAVWS